MNHIHALKNRQFEDFLSHKDKFHSIHIFQFVRNSRYSDILDFLLENEVVDVNITYDGKDLLFYAIESGSLDNVKVLLKHGIDTRPAIENKTYLTSTSDRKYVFDEFLASIEKELKIKQHKEDVKSEENSEIMVNKEENKSKSEQKTLSLPKKRNKLNDRKPRK